MSSSSHDLFRARSRIRPWPGLLVLLLALVTRNALPAEVPTADNFEGLVVEISTNALNTGQMLVVLRDSSGGYWLEEADFRLLKLRPPAATVHEQEGHRYLPLSAIAGAQIRLDEQSGHLDLNVPATAFVTARLTASASVTNLVDPPGTGAILNYQLYGQRVAGTTSGGALLDLSVFGPHGVLGNMLALRHDGHRLDANRLDTTFTRDFPSRMQTLRIGDAITSPGSWGSALRFAGVQFARNFALRPDLVTAPLLQASGSAVVPSAVDVFVNNQHVYSDQVQPGPFIINDLPVVTGSGDIQVVVRDALGREQVITQRFYSSPVLLSAGLDQYSFSVGSLRREFTQSSFRYGDLLGSADYRRGLSSAITVEGHAEVSRHARAIGASLAARVGQSGIAQLTLAEGGAQGTSGSLAGASWDRQGTRLSFGASLEFTTAGYRQLADLESNQVRPKTQATGRLGLNLGAAGNLSLAYARLEHRDHSRNDSLSLSQFIRVGSAGVISLLVTHQRGSGSSTTGFLGYSMSLGNRRSVEASTDLQRDRQVDRQVVRVSAMQSPPPGEGTGWRIGATHQGSYDAALQQRFAAADVELQAARDHGLTGQNVLMRGGATWLAGTARAARSVDGSFAVVDLDGLSDVPVYVENQLVTHTDQRGRAVLNNLLPYEINRISIDPVDLPLDTEIRSREITTQPAWHSGVLVKFPVQRIHPGLLRLIQPDGKPVPTGAVVSFNGGEFVVAKDGVTYVTTLDHGTTGSAQWPTGRCFFRASPPQAGEPLTDLGDVVCRPTQETRRR